MNFILCQGKTDSSSELRFDVNCDIRAHAASVNGSVGYRYDF